MSIVRTLLTMALRQECDVRWAITTHVAPPERETKLSASYKYVAPPSRKQAQSTTLHSG
jgi:hypothetical protein